MRAPTLLIDLDAKSCGDQNVILGLKPQITVAELCTRKEPIQAGNLKSILSSHSSGLAYLAAVSSGSRGAAADVRCSTSSSLSRSPILFKWCSTLLCYFTSNRQI